MLDLVHTDIYENDELKHWGILGMKWGIRRYQNPDGSLTPEGRDRYLKNPDGKINYINDNWRRASKEAEEYMKSNKKYEKFVNDVFYKEFRNKPRKDDPDAFSKYYDPKVFVQDGKNYEEDYVDYYTIEAALAQQFLEKEYDAKVKDII